MKAPTEVAIEIQVDTTDKRLVWDLFAPATRLEAGVSIEIPKVGTLTLKQMYFRKAFGAHDTLTFLLHHADEIATGMVGAWLFEKLKGRAQGLRIDRLEVRIDAESIRAILTRLIKGGND